MVHRLTRQQARRIAVRAQLLDAPRPTDPLDVVRRLWVVQVDLTAAVAPSADLVPWGRLGSAYSPDQLDALLVDRAVVEHDGLLRATDDIALFRADMRDWLAGALARTPRTTLLVTGQDTTDVYSKGRLRTQEVNLQAALPLRRTIR